jgi:hypothetical protein
VEQSFAAVSKKIALALTHDDLGAWLTHKKLAGNEMAGFRNARGEIREAAAPATGGASD